MKILIGLILFFQMWEWMRGFPVVQKQNAKFYVWHGKHRKSIYWFLLAFFVLVLVRLL